MLPLQKEWEMWKRLCQKGNRMYDKSKELQKRADSLRNTASEIYTHIELVNLASVGCGKAMLLWEKASTLWYDAVENHYGIDTEVKWRTWNEENLPTCSIGNDIYI
jgi:hypothetical protein